MIKGIEQFNDKELSHKVMKLFLTYGTFLAKNKRKYL